MDDARFDELIRRFRSRRTALAGLLGGLTALVSLGVEEAPAHNLARACRKLKDRAKRRRCLRRARRHKKQKHSCKPRPRAVTCKNRCDTVRTCKKKVRCTCPAGKTCLVNGGCNRACTTVPPVCPAGCGCAGSLAENPAISQCGAGVTAPDCGQIPLLCVSSANCPRGFFCAADAAVVCGTPRCVPNCPV